MLPSLLMQLCFNGLEMFPIKFNDFRHPLSILGKKINVHFMRFRRICILEGL